MARNEQAKKRRDTQMPRGCCSIGASAVGGHDDHRGRDDSTWGSRVMAEMDGKIEN